jgi:hypothetical protein
MALRTILQGTAARPVALGAAARPKTGRLEPVQAATNIPLQKANILVAVSGRLMRYSL